MALWLYLANSQVFTEYNHKALGGARSHCGPDLPLNKTNLNTHNFILSTN